MAHTANVSAIDSILQFSSISNVTLALLSATAIRLGGVWGTLSEFGVAGYGGWAGGFCRCCDANLYVNLQICDCAMRAGGWGGCLPRKESSSLLILGFCQPNSFSVGCINSLKCKGCCWAGRAGWLPESCTAAQARWPGTCKVPDR